MDEYIEREALLKKISRMIDYCKKDYSVNGLTALFQVCDAIIDCKSADAVPVVRCGECKHQRFTEYNVPYCDRVAEDGLDMPFDDCFCSYGEKREE